MFSEPLLDIRDLCAGYGDTDVLRGIDLKVEAGEIVAVLGSLLAGRIFLPGNGFTVAHGFLPLSIAHGPTLRAAGLRPA